MGFLKYLFRDVTWKSLFKTIGGFVLLGIGVFFALAIPFSIMALIVGLFVWSGSYIAIENSFPFVEPFFAPLTFDQSISLAIGIVGVLLIVCIILMLLYILFSDLIKRNYREYKREKSYNELQGKLNKGKNE